MTGHDLQAALDRVYRRVMMAIGIGVLNTGDDSGLMQKHQIQFDADQIRDDTLRVQEWGVASMPLPGARAVYVAVGGNRQTAVIIATDDPRHRLTGLKPGEAALYDDLGRKIHLTRDGIVIDGGGQPITLTGDLAITGNVAIDGNLKVTGTITDADGTVGVNP